MADTPETPEGVALSLMSIILERRRTMTCCGIPTKTELLDMYVDCLNAAIGFRPKKHGPPPAVH
jgi:hypothetical protein